VQTNGTRSPASTAISDWVIWLGLRIGRFDLA
jgi:hypothetical protein